MDKPNIDEQIARQKHVIDLHEAGLLEPTPSAQQAYDTDKAILSTLCAHKKLMEAKRPEPVAHVHTVTEATDKGVRITVYCGEEVMAHMPNGQVNILSFIQFIKLAWWALRNNGEVEIKEAGK